MPLKPLIGNGQCHRKHFALNCPLDVCLSAHINTVLYWWSVLDMFDYFQIVSSFLFVPNPNWASKGALTNTYITCLTVKAVNARDEEDICHCPLNGSLYYTLRWQKHRYRWDSSGRLGLVVWYQTKVDRLVVLIVYMLTTKKSLSTKQKI